MSSRDNRLVIQKSSNAKIENYKNVNYNTQYCPHCSKGKDTTEHAINCEVIGKNMHMEDIEQWKVIIDQIETNLKFMQ